MCVVETWFVYATHMWTRESIAGIPRTPGGSRVQPRLSWHDNRWWSTSCSLESRPLEGSTSRLFADRDEKEPRAIRERWLAESVFINSALENFPAGAEDRPTRAGERRRSGSSRRGKMKGRNSAAHRTGNHRRARNRAAGCACKSLAGSRPLRAKEPAICAARTANRVFSPLRSALYSGD